MGLRYAKKKPKHIELYKKSADPKCKTCSGCGTYYYADAYMSSGVTVICECVIEPAWRKWCRENSDTILFPIVSILGVLFWGWTVILWWRWFHTL